MKFDELGLRDELFEAVSYMGFTEATPIQEAAIPAVLKGKDLIACAQTGTGKTAAFLLPILDKVSEDVRAINKALIITPTRELAIQIEQQIQGLSYFVSVSSQLVYGGGDARDWEEQKRALTNGTDIIVATPGKLISHLKLGYVDMSDLKFLVLDEADRMLDMGFYDDIMTIIKYLPTSRQTVLFSATMPNDIKQLAKRILKDPEEIVFQLSKPAEGVNQSIYLLYNEQKTGVIAEKLKQLSKDQLCIIFCSTKRKVSSLVHDLKKKGFNVYGFSSDLEQDKREEILMQFKARSISILVATDVMSRGIDIKHIDMVINYDVPSDAEDYVHRVGRTARANTEGEAVTLVNEEDVHKLRRIEELIGSKIPVSSLPEELGPGPSWPAERKQQSKGKRKFYPKNKKKGGKHHHSSQKGKKQ